MRAVDDILHCVAFIGRPAPQADETVLLDLKGTAFFVSVPIGVGNLSTSLLVTAKHVADLLPGDGFFLRANTVDGGAMNVFCPVDHWWIHPEAPRVDIAVAPWSPPKEILFKNIPLSMFVTDDIIEEKKIWVGDEVLISGLFAHHSGNQRNFPIVRTGNVAMLPDEPVPTSVGPMEAYLIEARSIGGLSGSPVFVRQPAQVGLGKTFFLGLIHGHWDIPPVNRNDLTTIDTTGTGAVNMGIAIVVPAKKISEILSQPDLVAEIERLKAETLEKQEAAAAPPAAPAAAGESGRGLARKIHERHSQPPRPSRRPFGSSQEEAILFQ